MLTIAGFPSDTGLRGRRGLTTLSVDAVDWSRRAGAAVEPSPPRRVSMLKGFFLRLRRWLGGWFGRAARPTGNDWSRTRAPLVDDDRVMLSHTHAWLRSIPNGMHPKQLCRHYPRIANRIATTWLDVQATDRLLMDLMVDRRGNRMGFPPRIRQEIERLYGLHAKRKTPLLRGRQHAAAPATRPPLSRPPIEAPRRVRVRTPVAVSSIKR